MPFDLEGPTRIRNVKFDVFIGRPPIEDSSLLPKSFIPSKQWEFHSTKAIVGKTDDVSGLRPAALLGSDDEGYHWEADNPARTIIRDMDTQKVWTLSSGPDESKTIYVTLEDYREGDESQLWHLDIMNRD